jgi:hypothetical protein
MVRADDEDGVVGSQMSLVLAVVAIAVFASASLLTRGGGMPARVSGVGASLTGAPMSPIASASTSTARRAFAMDGGKLPVATQ